MLADAATRAPSLVGVDKRDIKISRDAGANGENPVRRLRLVVLFAESAAPEESSLYRMQGGRYFEGNHAAGALRRF